MKIRNYQPADCAEMAQLFYETVHTVNAEHYTKAQLDAWATGTVDRAAWNESFLAHHTVVAQSNSLIIGFGDMDRNGYLDRLYIHKDYQRKGVAAAIVKALEKQAAGQGIALFTTHASLTAKPFFERQGYSVTSKNTVVRNNVQLTNFLMEKHIVT